ncbi:uncharacterized protein LOC143458657 [Clavelina lepadiformis]|uniref:uncharacterized protein LOC143458657 n=1 Tax=Clavelina lepadiformis TaxID=159417 RepID=UPI0040411871
MASSTSNWFGNLVKLSRVQQSSYFWIASHNIKPPVVTSSKSSCTLITSKNISSSAFLSQDSSGKYSRMGSSRFLAHNIKDQAVYSQKKMYELDDKYGFIPNLHRYLSHRPEQFRCLMKYHKTIKSRENSNLTEEDREMIGLATSAYNGCLYCVISHAGAHRLFSGNPSLADQIAVNYNQADLDDRQRAILSLSMSVTKCDVLTEKHFSDLAKHGLDEEDAWDIASLASFSSMMNRMVTFLDVKPNEEYYSLGRERTRSEDPDVEEVLSRKKDNL